MRWAFFEDLHFLKLKIDISYIMNCEEFELYEMIYRYGSVLAEHKEVSKERKFMYRELIKEVRYGR